MMILLYINAIILLTRVYEYSINGRVDWIKVKYSIKGDCMSLTCSYLDNEIKKANRIRKRIH